MNANLIFNFSQNQFFVSFSAATLWHVSYNIAYKYTHGFLFCCVRFFVCLFLFSFTLYILFYWIIQIPFLSLISVFFFCFCTCFISVFDDVLHSIQSDAHSSKKVQNDKTNSFAIDLVLGSLAAHRIHLMWWQW